MHLIARGGGSPLVWRQALFLASLSLVASPLGACSTYRGEKYDPTAIASGPLGGIPYTLVKPQFLLTVTTPTTIGAQPTASLTYAPIPDASQSYRLRLDPGPLSTPNFKLTFNSNGSLASTTTSTAEQVTPTITALGNFIVAVAGAAKFAGGNAAGPSQDEVSAFRTALTQSTSTESTLTDCKAPPGYPPRVARGKIAFPAFGTTVAAAITFRMGLYYKTDATFTNGFVYMDNSEKKCLNALIEELKTDVGTYGNYSTIYTTPTDKEFISLLISAWQDNKFDTLKPDCSTRTANACTLTQQGAQTSLITNAKITAALAAFLKTVTAMSPDEWRARQVVFDEAELSRTDQTLTLAEAGSTDQSAIAAYRAFLLERRAELIDARDLYARSLSLEDYLARWRNKDVQGGEAPAAAEYAQYRAELDQLNTQMATLRTSTLAVLQPKSTPNPAYTASPVCWLPNPFQDPGDPTAKPTAVPAAQVNIGATVSVDAVRRYCNTQAGKPLDSPAPTYIVALNPQ